MLSLRLLVTYSAKSYWQGLLLLLQDLDHDPSNPNTRLYATHAAQPYHNDASDIVGKLLNMSCGALLTGLGTFVLLTAWL